MKTVAFHVAMAVKKELHTRKSLFELWAVSLPVIVNIFIIILLVDWKIDFIVDGILWQKFLFFDEVTFSFVIEEIITGICSN
jgi:hypothetical protein